MFFLGARWADGARVLAAVAGVSGTVASGIVAGVATISSFASNVFGRSQIPQSASLLGRLEARDRRFPDATVADFVDHIDYAVGLIGLDHVGISSDFDGGGGVLGWSDASATLNLTLELTRRGYTEAEIAQLWGGNLLRVMREVERVATARQAR